MTSSPRRDPYRLTGEMFGGRYRVEEFAGAGSFGAVYRATDVRLGRTVALKILKPDIEEADAAGARELFQREALTAGRLAHPHIVAVTDTGEEQGFAYLVMEWLEGRTLADELRARAPLPLNETAVLLEAITDALSAAHDAGVIHRDIKPSNIHLGRVGRAHVKVLDFGIAKVVDSSAAAASSRIAGTLYYMSPEQLGGDAIDRRADIYSLGIMLYQMLTGALPFPGESQGQVIHQHIAVPPPPLSAARPDLAPALSSVVERALAKRPDERQQTMGELYSDFVAALSPQTPQAISSDDAPKQTPAARDASPSLSKPAVAQMASDRLPATVMGSPPLAPTVVAAQGSTNEIQQATLPTLLDASGIQHERRTPWSDEIGNLKSVRNFALVGALVCFLLSIGVALFARWMEWTTQPYSYDDFVLSLIPLALRDTIFGAFLGASLSVLRRRRGRADAGSDQTQSAPRWSVVEGQRARSLVIHGATGAALLMLPFVLLRTSLFALPVSLAVVGFIAGSIIWGVRFAVQSFKSRQ